MALPGIRKTGWSFQGPPYARRTSVSAVHPARLALEPSTVAAFGSQFGISGPSSTMPTTRLVIPQ